MLCDSATVIGGVALQLLLSLSARWPEPPAIHLLSGWNLARLSAGGHAKSLYKTGVLPHYPVHFSNNLSLQ